MRPCAQALFAQAGVEVLSETESQESETIVRALLNGVLVTGPSFRYPLRREAQAGDAQVHCGAVNRGQN
jgi:hypothetical protein